LIENAIDDEQFRRSTSVESAKVRAGWNTQRLLIGAVGRLSSEKAFDILIQAVHDLVRRGLDVGLVIAGEGPDQAALKSLIRDSGLEDRVQLLGFRNDLRPVYEALDLFVLSSVREGLPNAVLEAMAFGVPVVATRVAGIPRLISDGENGLLVTAGDSAMLASGIERALANPALRDRLARSARQNIEDRYSFSKRMEKVTAVYDELFVSTNGAPSS
jgi:glycosyltransferase involved in cell wall biosynthesis